MLGAAAKAHGLSEEEVLLVVLADAHPARGTRSPWAAYAETLPPVAPDAGSWLPGVEQGLLAGTDLGAALLTEEEGLVALHARVTASAGELFRLQPSGNGSGSSGSSGGGGVPLSLAHLRWARGMLLSRRFAALPNPRQSDAGEQGLWGEQGSLVPLMDIGNHAATARVCTRGFAGDATEVREVGVGAGVESVTLVNQMPRRKGEEVFNNYGTRKSNEELLAAYGFALPGNAADRVMLRIASTAEAAAAEGAPAVQPTVCYVDRAGMTGELLEALVANASSAAAAAAGGGGGAAAAAAQEDEDEDEDDEAMDAAELAAVTLLGEALADKLNQLRETMPSEAAFAQAAAASPMSQQRAASVKHYRKGLERVLEATLRECEAMASGGELLECHTEAMLHEMERVQQQKHSL